MDRIDLKILNLLQQRIKLSTRIGQVKRRHGAAIYVPHREAELRARIVDLSRGKLPPQAVDAIYREIMSNSRAVQGEAPFGILKSGADEIMLSARWHFGACDQFVLKKNWAELASGIKSGALTVALLTAEALAGILKKPSLRKQFPERFNIVGDFSPTLDPTVTLARRILIVTARNQGVSCMVDRALILIECKSTLNAVKKLANSMPGRSLVNQAIPLPGRPVQGMGAALVSLTLSRRMEMERLANHLMTTGQSMGIMISLLGAYQGTENYGG